MDASEFVQAVAQLHTERNIPKDLLFDAVEAALVSAYKKNFGQSEVRVEMNRETGNISVFAQKHIVETMESPMEQISVEDARRLNPLYNLGDIAEIEVTPKNFGRIAAQAAKQVVIQKIREAERDTIYEEYANRESEVIYGTVQSVEQGNVYISLGRTEAIMPPTEQLPGEEYTPGQTRVKVYVLEVKNTSKGPQVFVSRTHPGLIKRLFENEVSELQDGTVTIKSVSREAGHRSKLAVESNDPNVDPVGACVGPRGNRVQSVVNDLKGEKIDIVRWHEDPRHFVSNALSPAKVSDVTVDETLKVARIIVPDNQLSLAIGKEGQNARLAAKLTGWKIDIRSESQVEDVEGESDE